MKKLAVLLAVLLFTGMLAACAPYETVYEEPEFNSTHKFLICDQKNRCLSVYDLNNPDWTKPEWTWTSKEKTFSNVDGAKFRFDPITKTYVIAFCSSGGFTGIVSYPTGELYSYITNVGGNPHSVEILPDGFLVVAASTGSYIRIYDTTGFGDISNKKVEEVYFRGAHGVLWDPDEEVLWALGDLVLTAYTVTEDHQLVERKDLTMQLPASGGHDLQPVYGDRDKLWVTTNEMVFLVSKSEGKIGHKYPGALSLMPTPTVKGIGSFTDGVLIMAQQNGSGAEWNTDRVTIGLYFEADDSYHFEERIIPKAQFYKLRVMESAYLVGPTE